MLVCQFWSCYSQSKPPISLVKPPTASRTSGQRCPAARVTGLVRARSGSRERSCRWNMLKPMEPPLLQVIWSVFLSIFVLSIHWPPRLVLQNSCGTSNPSHDRRCADVHFGHRKWDRTKIETVNGVPKTVQTLVFIDIWIWVCQIEIPQKVHFHEKRITVCTWKKWLPWKLGYPVFRWTPFCMWGGS